MNHHVIMERLLNPRAGKWKWTRRPIEIDSYKPLSSGVDGAVYEINANKKYVVKIMTDRDAFDMEKFVGSKPGIKRAGGVRVHGYTTIRSSRYYYYALILDHASFGHKDVAFTVPAKDYLVHIDNNHNKLHAFHRLFASKLKAFYRAVHGFHGDLHDQNVVVTLDKSRNLLNVVILDYGRFVPFDSLLRLNHHNNHHDNLRKALDHGHRTFVNATRNQHFTYLGVPRRAYKQSGTRNPSASNRNMLRSQRYWKGAYNRLVAIKTPAPPCSKRTVVELKQMLRRRHLKVSGNKPELCARLS